MDQKRTFRLLLAGLAIILVILPFVTTFNSILTGIINRFGLYQEVQRIIVPFESRLVISIINFLGVKAYLAPIGDQASFYLLQNTTYLPVRLEWNCLGWQSLLLLTISFFVGFQGHFKTVSVIECILIGVLGTFLVNIFRMVFITVGIFYINRFFAFLVHDYFAAFVTVIWLFVFWVFSYKYVLEDK